MKNVLQVLVTAALSSTFIVLATASASSAPATAPKKAPSTMTPLMRCIYTPQAALTTSSLPQVSMGFNFYAELNNGNEIGVDMYKLNAESQLVKQVGHAELTSSATLNSSTSLASVLGQMQLAEDSPFEFEITASNASSAMPGTAATIVAATTFNGESFSQIPVQCMAGGATAARAAKSNSAQSLK